MGCYPALSKRTLNILTAEDAHGAAALLGGARADQIFVLLQPGPDICEILNVTVRDGATEAPVDFFVNTITDTRRRLRSLHPVRLYAHSDGRSLAILAPTVEAPVSSVWLHVMRNGSDILILGSAVAADLVQYRQGDMTKAENGLPGVIGGFTHERANHLFEEQRTGEPPYERHADLMASALSDVVCAMLGLVAPPLLPNGAPGAVVITGDDDQAYPERYSKQLEMLAGLPITYFLHYLTRLTRAHMVAFFDRGHVELGLHPDALDDPENYAVKLRAQAVWFKKHVGFWAISVRNHGFLSQGYWDFVPHWLYNGLQISTNITATDGTAINGSYLPARIMREGKLTDHWSILTALGDGLLFAFGLEPEAAADKVRAAADAIINSRLPGVLVFNLHPQNVDRSAAMHRAVHDIVDSGFHVWTLRDCIAWFESRDSGRVGLPSAKFSAGPLDRLLQHIRW